MWTRMAFATILTPVLGLMIYAVCAMAQEKYLIADAMTYLKATVTVMETKKIYAIYVVALD